MTKKNELDEKQLEGVTGGDFGGISHGGSLGSTIGRVTCPCGCHRSYTYDFLSKAESGTQLGTCSNGWVAIFNTTSQVTFYNQTTKETRYADFVFDEEKHYDVRNDRWDRPL